MSPSPLSLSSSLPWLELSAGWQFGKVRWYTALHHPAHRDHGAHRAQTTTCPCEITYTTENVAIMCPYSSLCVFATEYKHVHMYLEIKISESWKSTTETESNSLDNDSKQVTNLEGFIHYL